MRRAVTDVATEFLIEAVSVMADHGLRIVGTAPSPAALDGARFIIEDPTDQILPDECLAGWRRVSFVMIKETYGRQTMVKIKDVVVSGVPELHLAA